MARTNATLMLKFLRNPNNKPDCCQFANVAPRSALHLVTPPPFLLSVKWAFTHSPRCFRVVARRS